MTNNPMYRVGIVIALFLCVSARAGDSPAEPKTYPRWDGSESVADYAKKINLSPTQTLDLGGGVKLELVPIPAGNFIMGTQEPEKPAVGQLMVGISGGIVFVAALVLLIQARKKRKRPQFSLALTMVITFVVSIGVWGGVRWHEALKHTDDFSNEHPAHAVTLTQPFYMGKFTVTQEQYAQIMGTNPSNFKGKDNPVEQVSWNDAQDFCKKLAEQTKQAVRLPTEAEWEFSCRAGTRTKYYSGDTDKDLDRVAWYDENSKNTTHPVGQKEPNAFGLYDMHGNVWQWCQDWYGEDYYGKSEAENPQGPDQGAFRLLRGGSCLLNPMICRSAIRNGFNPVDRDITIGFRIVLVPAFRTP